MLTGLRLTKGIKIKTLLSNTNTNNIDAFININNLEKFKKLGLIDMNNSVLKITNKGFPVLNAIINKLIL